MMENIKKTALVLISGLFIANTATATTLNISNDTGYLLAFTINGVCSSKIGKVSDFKSLSEEDFQKACGSGCTVEAYHNTCNSTPLGGVIYSDKAQTVSAFPGRASCVSTKATLESGVLTLTYYRRGWSCI